MLEIEVVTGSEIRSIPQPDGVVWPDDSLHVISRDESGNIVGRISLLPVVHIEGIWVDESKRGSTLASQLFLKAEEELEKRGFSSALSFVDPLSKTSDYVDRLGYRKMPFEVWQKEI